MYIKSMKRLGNRTARAGTTPLPVSLWKDYSQRKTGSDEPLLLWICGIVENRVLSTSVAVFVLHILHNKRKEKYFSLFIGKRSVNNGACRGRSLKFRQTTKTSLTAMRRHTNFAFTGPLRASTGRSWTLRQTDESASLSGSWKLV